MEFKTTQFHLIHLLSFLNKQPMNAFPDIQSFRKMASAIDELKKPIEEYFKKYGELEMALAKISTSYEKQLVESRLEAVKRRGDDYGTDPEFMAFVESLNQKMQKDKEFVKAEKAFREFQEAENSKEVTVKLDNPEYRNTVKTTFESKATKFEQWPNGKLVLDLANVIDQF